AMIRASVRVLWASVLIVALALVASGQQPDYLQSAQILLQQHKWKEAALDFQQALKQRPRDADAHIGLGIALWGVGDRQGAFAAFRRESEVNPASARAHFNVALALRDAGQTDQALAELNRALKLKPDHEEARLALGLILQQRGDLAGAVTQY